MCRILGFVFTAVLICSKLSAQVLQVSPLFPTRNEQITITYDASLGNGALTGVSPIYVHTGLITTSSINYNDWKNVQDNWGTADAATQMTSIGNNKFTFTFNINSFYNPGTDTIIALGFVFRNTDGTLVGRNADTTNIDLTVYNDSFQVAFIQPSAYMTLPLDSTLNLHAAANKNCNMVLTENGNILSIQNGGDSLYYNNFHFLHYGAYNFTVTGATGGDTLSNSVNVLVNPPVNVQNPPAGVIEGINYMNDSTVILELLAPYKSFIYVLGDFNNWQADTAYMMRESTDGKTWWLQISHLTAQKEYIFQYLVDGYIRTGDPYCEKVSDPYVDINIPQSVYPNLISYPTGKTTGVASVFEINRPEYVWQTTNFQRPAKGALNIYEMWVGDFVTSGSWHQAKDSLDYLVKLGINAIEVMPAMNFEGTSGWGYNPNYFCASEKMYGPEDSMKMFIDLCHSKGMAVILDIPFNDAFGTNPMVMMYWDTMNAQPAANNPWFNQVAPHPYSVGYDFNHASTYTRNFVTRVTRYWLKEYHTDGYRFDLTKGYTQTYSGDDVGLWGEYDAARVGILEGMVDSIWSADPTAYCVFEQLSENQEETELANHGILLWGNLNTEYNQATMGYSTGWDLSWASYQDRGWSEPNLVTYMESHDEERLMYNNEQYGDSVTGYDIKQADTGCQRMEAAGAVFYTIPGPKMIYMFGEMGYDLSINNGCRICNKPILWSYYKKPYRLHLYKVWAALNKLRNNYPATFQTTNYTINLTGPVKSVQLNGTAMDAVAVANFDEGTDALAPGFQHTGWWYDYFTGDSLNVTDVNYAYNYARGEYHVYTDKALPVPDLSTASIPAGIDETFIQSNSGVVLYPNPNNGVFDITFDMAESNGVQLSVYDLDGRMIYSSHEFLSAGVQNMQVKLNQGAAQHVAPGIYFYRLAAGQSVYNGKISIVNE